MDSNHRLHLYYMVPLTIPAPVSLGLVSFKHDQHGFAYKISNITRIPQVLGP